MKFLVGMFILVLTLPALAQVQYRTPMSEDQDVIDFGLLRPTIVNGAVVPNSKADLLAMTPHIYIMDSSEKFAVEKYCTGLLIAPEVILTAAHCLNAKPKDLFIEVYFQDRTVEVKSFVLHPEYEELKNLDVRGQIQTSGGYNDMALIFLQERMNQITPALLPVQDYHLKDDTKVTMAGYGQLGPDELNTKGDLHYVEVPVKEIKKGRLSIEGKKTSCKGDSGGPLLLKRGDRWMSVGVISIGDCEQLATHMRTSKYSDWIQDQIEIARSSIEI